MSNSRKTVGANLRFYRKARGFSQEKLAFTAGIDSGYISMLELGKVNVSIDFLDRICAVLKIEVVLLFQKPM